MKFVSTRNNKKLVDFKKASLEGLATDGGLYIPYSWNFENIEIKRN